MPEKRITIRIGKGGSSFKATAKGFEGNKCEQALSPLQKVVAGELETTDTDEMNKKAEEQINEQI